MVGVVRIPSSSEKCSFEELLRATQEQLAIETGLVLPHKGIEAKAQAMVTRWCEIRRSYGLAAYGTEEKGAKLESLTELDGLAQGNTQGG